MKVQFDEGLLEVTVEGVYEPVKRGEPVEVSDEVGKQLCEQGWHEVGASSGRSSVVPKVEAKPSVTPTPVEKENE